MILNALAGQAAAGLRRRPATCATGSTSRTTARRCARCSSAGVPGETYNVGGDAETTNLEVVRTLCDRARRAAPATGLPTAQCARSRSSPTARATTAATRSTPARSAASSAGARGRRSRRASRTTRCAGTSTTRTGASGATQGVYREVRSALQYAAAASSDALAAKLSDAMQGHHPRRRLAARGSTRSRRSCQQAAAAGLRQADDLLPAVDADAGRASATSWSSPRPQDMPRFRAAARRRQRSWGMSLRYAVQPEPGGPRAGVPHRRATSSAADPSALVLGDNIFYGHGLHRAAARAPTRATDGRDGLRLPRSHDPERYGVVEFDAAGRALSHRGEAARSRSRTTR